MRPAILLPTILVVLATVFSSFGHVHAQTSGRMYFMPDAVEVANNTTFTTAIYIDTAGNDAAGAGAIVLFNPVFLEVVGVQPGIIFDDYPLAAIDNDEGKVVVSGIAGSTQTMYRGDGLFASITWRAKRTGTTEVTFDFEPGSTTDSNIAVRTGTGDILGSVGNLDILISAGSAGAATASPTEPSVPATTSGTTGVAVQNPSILDRALSALSRLFGRGSEEGSAYGTIGRQEPRTTLNGEDDEQVFVSQAEQPGPNYAMIGLGAGIIITLIVAGYAIYKLFKRFGRRAPTVVTDVGDSTPNQPPPPFPPMS